MARRTKEDAEATRHKLLDAAQDVFQAKGVSGASLAEVAQAAGVTRGAIYWHFEDKSDLFDAMLKRATLPLEQACIAGEALALSGGAALPAIVDVVRTVLRVLSTDEVTRRAFDIALYKTECVGEMQAVRERRIHGTLQFMQQMEAWLAAAVQQEAVHLQVSIEAASRGLHAVLDGMLHAWLLRYNQAPFDLEREGVQAVLIYLRGLGFAVMK